jgi:hypothetical protein
MVKLVLALALAQIAISAIKAQDIDRHRALIGRVTKLGVPCARIFRKNSEYIRELY